jgi:HemY protein
VRALLWVIGLFALATGLVLFARTNAGYVLVASHGTRVEFSLNLGLLLLLLAVAGGYLLLRAAVLAFELPAQARAFRERRRREAGRAAFDEALRAYFEGRYGRAERAAVAAAEASESPGLSAVIAARAAHEMRAFSRRDEYLARTDGGPEDDYVRQITQAELLLGERRHHDALAVLGRIRQGHTAALRLELEAERQARNWDRVLALLPQLEKKQVFDDVVMAHRRRTATAESLKRKVLDPRHLKEAWERIAPELRRDPLVARTAARCFLSLGGTREAQRVIEDALAAQWDPPLASLYAECMGEDPRALLQKAEGWLREQRHDPALLLTLGRLCVRASLWGKARSYFEASLAVEPSQSAHLELAGLAGREGREADATRHREAALELALAQLRESTGGRRREPL